MHKSKIILLILVLGLTTYLSCDTFKGPDLKLSTDKEEIPAGGNDHAVITATLKKQGDPEANQQIEFETTNGSFSTNEEQNEVVATTNSEGIATVKLYSAPQQGQATVTATYKDDASSNTYTANISITFGEPSASSLPTAGNFNLDCNWGNVGALISTSKPDVRVECEITAKNIRGEAIPPQSLTLHFQAEAGELTSVYDDYDDLLSIIYRVRGGESMPMDVEPLSGEPSRACGGGTCNPRDGLVTLVVVTRGSENFEDRNGNNQWDDGEPFDDLPEPFLDKNDNGIRDEGEWYFDSNSDGEYTEANGFYDTNTMIWANFKILWTGKPEENETAAWITHSPSSTTLPDGGSITFNVKLIDKNLNPVAGFGAASDDEINFIDAMNVLEPTQPPSDPGTFIVENMVGLEFDEQWRFLSCDENAAEFSTTFIDDSTGSTSSEDFLIGIDANLAPGPEGEDGRFNQYNYFFSTQISGTVQAAPQQ